MQQRDVQLGADRLLTHYRDLFYRKYGSQPLVEVVRAMEILRWAITNLGEARSNELLTTYFQIKDEWVEKRAYPLNWFRDNINEVIANSSTASEIPKDVWVIGISDQSGHPVCSNNRNEMGAGYWFKPMLFSEWLANFEVLRKEDMDGTLFVELVKSALKNRKSEHMSNGPERIGLARDQSNQGHHAA